MHTAEIHCSRERGIRRVTWFGLIAVVLSALLPAHAVEPPLCVVSVLVDHDALSGAHDVEVAGKLAYVAGKGGSLAVIDVSDPARPRLLWSRRDAEQMEDAETVLPAGDHLFLGTRDFLSLDIREPRQPVIRQRIFDRMCVDRINGMIRQADVVLAANKSGWIDAFDVSRPDAPELRGALNVGARDGLSSPHDIDLYGDFVVIVDAAGFGRDDRPGQLGVYRAFNAAAHELLPADQWTLVGRVTGDDLAGANRVKVFGHYACVGSSLTPSAPRGKGQQPNVAIIDLSYTARPAIVAKVPFDDTRGPNGLAVAGNVAFAAGGQTIAVIDLSNPARPIVLDSRKYPDIFRDSAGKDDAHDLVYRDSYLYVTGQTTHSLGILRLSDKRIGALAEGSASAVLTTEVSKALERISADSLRGHISFLASDLLGGRGTPSKGLDIAAEYIAAQFRRAGLEPIGDDGYFQTADWKYLAPEPGSFSCEALLDGETIRVTEQQVSGSLTSGVDLRAAATLKVNARDADALAALTAEAVGGKIILAEVPHPYKAPRSQLAETNAARFAFLRRMEELNPVLVIDVDRDSDSARGLRLDVATFRLPLRRKTPLIQLHSPQLCQVFDMLPHGPTNLTITVRVGEPQVRAEKVRNVVGLLRGSKAEEASTYVLLTAHYDHLGIAPHDGSGDRVYNGANDDASGAASVIEIAAALATLEKRPQRSLVFVAFYGEEHGMVGSEHYAANPVVPLARTVAAINLEQLGRTDDSDGPRVASADVTGFDFSEVGAILHRAGAAVGIAVEKRPQNDRYFAMSDNIPLARAGIPAHTISVAFQFPDYHGADDEWEKIDYANMAKVDRMAALGLLLIADGPAPRWNADNPKAATYLRAAETSR